MAAAFHHVELWTRDFAATEAGWHWLLTSIGWQPDETWHNGRSWAHYDGSYLVLEQSSDVHDEAHDRHRPGLNHLALNAGAVELDDLRATALQHGWDELFAERYPHASGAQHNALFLENGEGFEVEVVATAR